MKGTYTVQVRSKKLQFSLELERNLTVIRGDSGTGKTTLIGMLQDYEALGPQSGVSVSCAKPCRVLEGPDWETRLAGIRDSIVFIDEGNAFMHSQKFAHAIRKTDNYYVLITRENLYQLPYSVESVLTLKNTTSRKKRTYNKAYPYYKTVRSIPETLSASDRIVTEDSNAGFQMFSHLAALHNTTCVCALGKSNIYRQLESTPDVRTIVVADGAAFGADMEKVYQFQQRHPQHVTLYLPESFEWLLLKAGVIFSPELKDILAHPSDYIDPTVYFSWEQYFTALLILLTGDIPYMKYSKLSLPDFYLQPKIVQRVLDTIEGRSE